MTTDTLSGGETVGSMRELRDSLEKRRAQAEVTPFQLRAPLPKKGRTDAPVVATDHLWAVLKCYAGEGENELHAHPHEDHLFLVLQGEAEFSGKDGVVSCARRFSGALMPAGALYKFRAVGEEPLVMLRVGAPTRQGADRHHRVHPDGKYFDPFTPENNFEAVEFHEGRVFK